MKKTVVTMQCDICGKILCKESTPIITTIKANDYKVPLLHYCFGEGDGIVSREILVCEDCEKVLANDIERLYGLHHICGEGVVNRRAGVTPKEITEENE